MPSKASMLLLLLCRLSKLYFCRRLLSNKKCGLQDKAMELGTCLPTPKSPFTGSSTTIQDPNLKDVFLAKHNKAKKRGDISLKECERRLWKNLGSLFNFRSNTHFCYVMINARCRRDTECGFVETPLCRLVLDMYS